MSGRVIRGDNGELIYAFVCSPSEVHDSGALGGCYECGAEAEVCEQCGHAVCSDCLQEMEGCSQDACECMECLRRVEGG